eukprot:g2264.t1
MAADGWGWADELTGLLFWLNSLPIPSAMLVDSADDLRDGSVLVDVIAALPSVESPRAVLSPTKCRPGGLLEHALRTLARAGSRDHIVPPALSDARAAAASIAQGCAHLEQRAGGGAPALLEALRLLRLCFGSAGQRPAPATARTLASDAEGAHAITGESARDEQARL